MKKIIIFLLILTIVIVNFTGCKKSEVLNKGNISITFTRSDATTTSTGFKYYLQFDLTETGGVEITLSNVHIYLKSNGANIGEVNYTATQALSNNKIYAYDSLSSKYLTLTHDSDQSGDALTVTISGSDANGNSITSSGTATLPDLSQYPTINSFEVDKTVVEVGETAVISWVTSNATRIYIERNGNTEHDNLEASGSIVLYPTNSGQENNNYILYATNDSNSVHSSTKSIKVNYPDVEYRVSGVARANIITISGNNESTEQYSRVTLPWTYKMSSVSSGGFLYLSAQSDMRNGCIKVEIFKNGELWKDAESCGQYVIASASGSY